ncbi:MAG: signal peptide peptidase SppA [Bacteroidota bacterium]
MGKFLQFVFASCLGVILATVLLFGIGSAILTQVVSNSDAAKKVSANSILELKLNSAIPEKTNNVPVNSFDFSTDNTLGLQDVKNTLELASEDDNIKGIFLDLSGLQIGRATASSIRDAILDFREKEKFVVAYSQYYSQGAYYMASAADKVYVNPVGGLDFTGFAASIPFFKDMLDRLDVKVQVYYAGKFKSATEPFRRTEMSEENRLQTREYLESMYEMFLKDIAASRNVEVPELRKIADEYLIRLSEDAVTYGLVDEMGYRDEVYDYLRQQLGLEDEDKLKMVSMSEYEKGHKKKKNLKAKDKIAVVYAEGELVGGEGEPGNIGGAKYASILRKIRRDDKVKAIVLRINSPGGSGLASDEIWRELILAKEKGIPVVASMGDLAASGGYYIACPADTIYAAKNTITGSIGVFGMIPSVEQSLKENVGVTFDNVKTGPFALGLSPFRDLTEAEGKIVQEGVEEFYEIFLKRVSDGRNMSREEVHEIAQGRVWTGKKAKDIGLVDQFGELEDAIACASRMAELDDYRLTEYPRSKERFQQIIEEFTGQSAQPAQALIRGQLGEYYPYYNYFRTLKDLKGVQARMPFAPEMKW